MAAIAFDPLEYSHQLEACGVPREQAEVHAKAMTAMFLHNFDALVTKDYLDTRFSEFETRVQANMDKRFAELESNIDKRFAEFGADMDRRFGAVDARFAELESNIDKRFAEFGADMDRRFGAVDARFAELESNIDKRFAEFGADMDRRFGAVDARFADLDVRFAKHSVLQKVILAALAIPVLQTVLVWIG